MGHPELVTVPSPSTSGSLSSEMRMDIAYFHTLGFRGKGQMFMRITKGTGTGNE
jgi:hypothetical protein